MSSEEFLHNIDAYPNFCLKRRPSMSLANPLPLQSPRRTPHFAPSLPDVDSLFDFDPSVQFITDDPDQREADAHLRKRLPRVTVSAIEQSVAAEEFESEFHEANKRSLPAY